MFRDTVKILFSFFQIVNFLSTQFRTLRGLTQLAILTLLDFCVKKRKHCWTFFVLSSFYGTKRYLNSNSFHNVFNYLILVSSFTSIKYSIQSYSSSFFQTTKDLLVLIFQMAREMRSIHNWCEAAPTTLLISHSRSRRSSNSFRLEPIIEEEPQLSKSMLEKGVFSFPLLLSGLLYIFFYRELSVHY